MASWRKRLATAAGAAVAVLVALGLGPAELSPAVPAGEGRTAGCITPENEVAVGQVLVVVAFPGGTVTRCVAPGGSGIDLLRQAGFDPITSGYSSVGSAAVCALRHPTSGEQLGCQTGDDCLKCLAPDYWAYFGCWRYLGAGAGSTTPGGGTIEGWRWGRASTWPGGERPASCDSDGDDVATPEPTTPPPPTSTPSGGGGSSPPVPGGGTRPSTPGSGGPGTGPGPSGGPGPGTTTSTDPSDPSDPSTPDDGDEQGEPTGPTSTGDGPTATSDGDAPATGAGDGGGRSRGEPEGEEAAVGGGVPAGGGRGGGEGGAAVPLVATGLVVAGVGGGALYLRRRHRPI